MAGPYTMSQLTTPSKLHTGVQVAAGVIASISATTAAAALIYLTKVPDGATILDWTLWLNDNDRVLGGANQKIVIGTSASSSGLGVISTSGTQTLDPMIYTGRFSPRGDIDLMPVHISLSDSIAGQDVWLVAKIEVAPSTSNTAIMFKFECLYTCDGMIGHTTIR